MAARSISATGRHGCGPGHRPGEDPGPGCGQPAGRGSRPPGTAGSRRAIRDGRRGPRPRASRGRRGAAARSRCFSSTSRGVRPTRGRAVPGTDPRCARPSARPRPAQRSSTLTLSGWGTRRCPGIPAGRGPRAGPATTGSPGRAARCAAGRSARATGRRPAGPGGHDMAQPRGVQGEGRRVVGALVGRWRPGCRRPGTGRMVGGVEGATVRHREVGGRPGATGWTGRAWGSYELQGPGAAEPGSRCGTSAPARPRGEARGSAKKLREGNTSNAGWRARAGKRTASESVAR